MSGAAWSSDGTPRYCTPWQIGVAAILGGPLAGGYLASRNHALFGTQRKARTTLALSALLVCGLLYVSSLALPHASGTPIAAAVAGGYRWYAGATFDGEIAQRRAAGWLAHSWWRVMGISLLVLVAMLLAIYMALLISQWFGTRTVVS
jgi:hypothetical protein